MHAVTRRVGLSTEFLIFMIGFPVLLYTVLPIKYLLPMIWGAALYCYVVIRITRGQAMDEGWGTAAVTWRNLKPILLRFAICAALMAGFTYVYVPEYLFIFVSERPLFWLMVMFLYPLLSVIPQEVIFRSFFFMRYQHLFPKPLLLIVMSGVAFGFAHILFHNWIAPLMCLIGGIIFALTFAKHRSLLLVIIEHALYGDFMFTIGLGRYFYHGSVALAS